MGYVKPPKGSSMTDTVDQSTNHKEKLTQIIANKSFVGREFLTWLWCFIDEKSDEQLEIYPKGHRLPIIVRLWVDDRIVLDSKVGFGHRHLMRGGDPSSSPEASVALATGKTVVELKVGLNIEGVGDFSLVLNSSELSPRSIQLPGEDDLTKSEENAFLPAAQRIKQTSLLLQTIDHLFSTFINARVSDNWESDSEHGIKEWIADRSQRATNEVKQIIH